MTLTASLFPWQTTKYNLGHRALCDSVSLSLQYEKNNSFELLESL